MKGALAIPTPCFPCEGARQGCHESLKISSATLSTFWRSSGSLLLYMILGGCCRHRHGRKITKGRPCFCTMSEMPERRSGSLDMGIATSSEMLLVRSFAAALPRICGVSRVFSASSADGCFLNLCNAVLPEDIQNPGHLKLCLLLGVPVRFGEDHGCGIRQRKARISRRTRMELASMISRTLGMIPECMMSLTA